MEFSSAALRAQRERLDLNPYEFADRVGCHASSIHEWERGAKSPSLQSMLRLMNALDCSLADLMTDNEAPSGTSLANESAAQNKDAP
jgi:transcriptional regulator with XRE-family HTH domain